ncbi:MAG TPA: hypothetical protein VMM76_09405 [Pirellulaceae bacterium]|nr:hypothetical protein [Pirellulaceae bacterium]
MFHTPYNYLILFLREKLGATGSKRLPSTPPPGYNGGKPSAIQFNWFLYRPLPTNGLRDDSSCAGNGRHRNLSALN